MLVTDEMVKTALSATPDELPESVQYALIRGLSAIGWELPANGAFDVMRAAIEAVAPAIRAAALEEAAKECDFMAVETTKLADRLDDKESRLYALLMVQAQAAKNRAAAIRALKESS